LVLNVQSSRDHPNISYPNVVVASVGPICTAMSRVFALGLDGVGLDLWRRLSERGWLPSLASRFKALVTLDSTVPPLTAPAWTSIASGLNPGRHGVLDFWTRPSQGQARILIGNSFGRAFWEVAGAQGFGVGVFNYPLSYPPRPVNGFWVSGMNTPRDAPDFATPASLVADMAGFVPDTVAEMTCRRDLRHRVSDRLALLRDLIALQDHHLEAGLVAMRKSSRLSIDLFVFALTTTDRFLHFFWDCVGPVADYSPLTPPPALADLAARFWRALDSGVDRWLNEARPDSVILFSDHGFQSVPHQVFNMPVWLRSVDWTSGAYRVPANLGILRRARVAAKDAAKRLLPEFAWQRIRGRLAGASSASVVGPIALETLYGQVIGLTVTGDTLARSALVDTALVAARKTRDALGRPVFEWAEFGSVVWPGAPATFPDAVMCLRADLGAGSSASDPRLMFDSVTERLGDHAPQGVFGISEPLIPVGAAPLRVWDVPAIVLQRLGAAIPDDLDGRVPDWLPGERVYVSLGAGGLASSGAYSAAQTEELTNRLRQLGYVD